MSRIRRLDPLGSAIAHPGWTLVLFERAFGPEHYELAVNFNNLAALRYARGDNAEAERLYQTGQ